jgi:oxygen-dependent protoporphyrinogen oxidase
MSVPHVVVVGGGIAGLAAAHGVLAGAPAGHVRVTVLEAQDQLGGKIRTSPFAGLPAVDEGPDAFLARIPWATAFAREVGLGDELVSPTPGSAAVWWNGLHRLPEGLLLGMPTDVVAMARSKLLTWPGKIRAATEVLRPRTSIEGDSIGEYVRARFGDQVHERLVDPLVGSIYAADTDQFSLAAVPQIAELARGNRSVLVAARRRPAAPAPAAAGPVFYAPAGGLGRLIEAAAAAVVARGGTIRTGAPCTSLDADGSGWRVDGDPADAVVLACPSSQAARLLPDGEAAAGLRAIPAADVVMVTVAVPSATWPERLHGLSGYLVPKPVQHLVTAVSFGSQKWQQWSSDGQVVLRISLGRDGLPVLSMSDDQLVAAAIDETSAHLGVHLAPTAVRVTPWQRAFPQYRPHHAAKVAAISAALPAGVMLAGASYHGIGIPTCVRSGQQAATAALARVGVGS